MALLESDLVDVMQACINGRLQNDDVLMRDGAAATVVIASPQYPAETFPTGLPIQGLRRAKAMTNVELFHHGTACRDGKVVTARGRVLGVTGVGESLTTALERAYAAVGQITFPGAHFRRDIGLNLQNSAAGPLPAGDKSYASFEFPFLGRYAEFGSPEHWTLPAA